MYHFAPGYVGEWVRQGKSWHFIHSDLTLFLNSNGMHNLSLN